MPTKKTNSKKDKEHGPTPGESKTPKSNSVTYTKKETDTPQFKERDRSANSRAAQNNQ